MPSQIRLGDDEVPVVDLDDLIQMKLAGGRPVDLVALTDLNCRTLTFAGSLSFRSASCLGPGFSFVTAVRT